MVPEVPPSWEIADKPPDDVEVEEERERDLTELEHAEVFGGGVGGARRLEDDGGESEEHPDPFRAVVPLLDRGLTGDGAPIEDAVLVVLRGYLAQPTQVTSSKSVSA